MKYRLTRKSVSILLVSIFLMTFPCYAMSSSKANSKSRIITSTYQQLIDNKKIPGTVLLVAHKGKIEYLKALGSADIEKDIPMRADTMFRIASMTKAITAVAVLQEWERGAFKLDDPISKYIPEFANPKVLVPNTDGINYTLVPAKREISIWSLLTSTSGICYAYATEGSPQLHQLYVDAKLVSTVVSNSIDNAEHVKRIASLPLRHNPGESWTYGLSYDVLGRLVEVTSGKSLDEYFKENILGPLSMDDTYFHVPAEKVEHMARPYWANNGSLIRLEDGVVNPDGSDTSYCYENNTNLESGGGGLVSTILDYYKYLQMMQNKGILNGVRILEPRTVEMMTMNQTGNVYLNIGGFGPESIMGSVTPGSGFGFGAAVLVDPSKGNTWAHPGQWSWGGQWGTSYWVDPVEDLIIIQMQNTVPNAGQYMIHQLGYELIQESEK